MPKETGRWRNIDRSLRKCTLCDSNNLGDEFHYLYRCTFVDEERRTIAPFIRKRSANCFVFSKLFNEENHSILKKTCMFLETILTTFRSLPG